MSRDVVFREDIFPYKDKREVSHQIPITVFEDDFTNNNDQVADTEEETGDVHEDNIEEPEPKMPLRRSHRETRRPGWLEDYITNVTDVHSTKEKYKDKTGSIYPFSALSLVI